MILTSSYESCFGVASRVHSNSNNPEESPRTVDRECRVVGTKAPTNVLLQMGSCKRDLWNGLGVLVIA